MSRNYIPVPERKPKPQPNIWFGVGIGAFVALLAVCMLRPDPGMTRRRHSI